MRCREAIDPALPIPELIKLIKHSFQECEFDEVQNILMERERCMEVEMVNVVRDRDSLKEYVDFLEKTQAYLELEKCDLEDKLRRSQRRNQESKEKLEELRSEKLDVEEKLGRSQRRGEELDEEIVQSMEKLEELRSEKLDVEEKLGRSQRRGEELDEEIVQSKEKFEKLRSEKLDVEEKLGRSQRRGEELEKMIVRMKEKFEKLCEEMDERVVKMGKEIEELRREKLCASKTIEELKNGTFPQKRGILCYSRSRSKEMEADSVVQQLKRKDVETVDELIGKKMKSEKANAVTPEAGVGSLAHYVTKGDGEGKEKERSPFMSKLICALNRYSSGQVQGR